MALDAGAVYVKLGGKLDPSGFNAFSAAVYKSKADMERGEKAIVASHDRIAKGAKLAALGVAGIAVGGTAIFIKGAIDAAKTAASFEQELKKLSARSDITEKQLRRVRQAALDQGTAMGVGARQAAKASTELVKGGLSVQKLLSGGLKGALALAVAGEMDVAQAAETTATALNLFKMRGEEATHVADALATAANATTADVSDFAIALTQGGAAAKAAGLSFDETIAFLETLAVAGVKGSDAGTSMKTALVQLANPTKESAALMEKLGIDLFDVQGNIKPLPALAGMFQDKLKGLTKEQRLQAATTLAGTDGMRALLALYDAGPKAVEKFLKSNKEQGAAAEVAAKQNEGAAGAAKRLRASWEQAQILFGEQLLPAIAEGADTLSKKLQEMADDGTLKEMGQDMADLATAVGENIPEALEAISGFLDTLGGAGDAVSTLGDLASAAETIGKMSVNPGSLLSGGIWDGFLQGARAAVVAVRAAMTAIDALGVVDMSGPLRKAKTALDEIDAARERIAHSDLQIHFDMDPGAQEQIFKLADKLEAMGKKQSAINIIANADSAEEALRGLAAAAKGVPEKVVLSVIANSRSAAEQVLAFQALAAGVPASKVTKIQTEAKTASTAVMAFRALAAGVPASKVTKVLAETNSARAQINGIIGLIAAVPSSKNVTITTTRVNTLIDRVIKDPGKVQVKPRGKAAGGRTTGPELYLVGEGSDPVEWIIPRDPKYRGRAMGLLMDAAKSILPGFAKGGKTGGGASASAKPPKKKRYLPPKLDPIAYDVSDFETRVGTSKDAIDKAKQIAKNLANARTQLRRADRMPTKTAKQKAARKDSIDQAQRRIDGYEKDLKGLPQKGSLERLRADWAQRKAELKAAKAYQLKIDRTQKQADNAADQMRLADKRDDEPGYQKARKDRDTALKALQGLLGAAKTLSEKAGNVDRVLDLDGALGTIANDLIDNDAAVQDDSPAQQAADRLADTGMTDAERARLADINKDIALAGLTQTLDDDKAAAGAKVSFLEGILNDALVNPARGGSESIAELADQLKTARDNVTSFSGGTANENADLQAQIEQEKARTEAATTNSRISEAALAAFEGFASGGPGGLAPVINIHQTNLVPGSSDVLRSVGDAAAAGFDVQGYKRPNMTRVGP